jgi:hypothetical protein
MPRNRETSRHTLRLLPDQKAASAQSVIIVTP